MTFFISLIEKRNFCWHRYTILKSNNEPYEHFGYLTLIGDNYPNNVYSKIVMKYIHNAETDLI